MAESKGRKEINYFTYVLFLIGLKAKMISQNQLMKFSLTSMSFRLAKLEIFILKTVSTSLKL
jgi:hypothetical protein